jgi:predicted nucleic acid-binding protein
MKKVVVDASLGIKWVLEEHDSEKAEDLLVGWLNAGVQLYAPALFIYEINNVLFRRVTIETAQKAHSELLGIGLILDFSQSSTLSARAMELAHQFNMRATYDAHYLALAERESCDLWTADARMWRLVRECLNWVHCLGDV